MKNLLFSIGIFISILSLKAENDSVVTISKIWDKYEYYPKSIASFNWFSDSTYSVLEGNSGEKIITKYNVIDQNVIDTIFSSSNTPTVENDEEITIEKYVFSEDKKLILLFKEGEALYRRSMSYNISVYDIESKKIIFNSKKKVFNPSFSPDGKKVAYSFKNNLFYYDLDLKKETQITHDGKWNAIINGRADWVYEEEFEFTKAYEWSPLSDKIVFLKFNESEVKEYNMQIWDEGLYPKDYRFKYPKAGEQNAKVDILVYDLVGKDKKTIFEGNDEYTPRIYWSNNEEVSYQWLNRKQNQWKLFHYNINTKYLKAVLSEKSTTYVDLPKVAYVNQTIFYTSERDGFNHIYLHSLKKNKSLQITKGNWEVTKIDFIDTKNERIYYTSTEFSSTERNSFRVDFKGRKKICITPKKGTHNIHTNGTFVVDYFSSITTPKVVSLLDDEGKTIKILEDNKELQKVLSQTKIAVPEITKIDIGSEKLNAYVIKPLEFDPSKKHPVLMYVYGGPGIQTVRNTWLGMNYMWYQLLLAKGYVIVSVDGRGTGGKGAEFKKCTYSQLGKLETEDQISAAKVISNWSFIDSKRVGIWGWSFGGYLSSLCLFKGNDIFKTGIAVAPVTSWRFYDSIYTERFLDTPQNNPKGYDENSPIQFADRLKGNYLLIHGTADDNVHIQNSYQLQNALIKANKQFNHFYYPDKNHSLFGGNTRSHLYQMMTDFILEKL